VEGPLDVERLVEHLLFPFLERCLRLGEKEMATRLCEFLDRLVTNPQDERLVNQLRERASQIFTGIAPRVRYPRHPRSGSSINPVCWRPPLLNGCGLPWNDHR
jgi:hypothetical protein